MLQTSKIRTFAPFPLVLLVSIVALTLLPGLALHQEVSPVLAINVLEIFKFTQDFLTGSVFLGIVVAIIVNLFKPRLPDGYADTFSTIVTIVLLSLIFIAKAFYPNLTLAGLEQLFNQLSNYSPLWVPVLAWIIRYISGEANQLLSGIPFIGFSHSYGSIADPDLR